MNMKQNSEDNGIPIYLDNTDRYIADSMDEKANSWYPSNSAAQKLWRCLESMRDIENLLAESADQKNATKRKRKLKIAITPLHSLITAIDDLCNNIQSNPDIRNQLEKDQIKDISAMKTEFAKLMPHDHKSPISKVRNKLSSHIDKKLHPNSAQKLSNVIKPHEFGRWLHICLHLVLDLTKLNIYEWACDAPDKEYKCFMHNEPFIVTFKLDGENVSELAAVNLAKSSPRNAISEIVDCLVKHSQWMFKKGQPRIYGLKEDNKDNWNTFSSNLHIHKSF